MRERSAGVSTSLRPKTAIQPTGNPYYLDAVVSKKIQGKWVYFQAYMRVRHDAQHSVVCFVPHTTPVTARFC